MDAEEVLRALAERADLWTSGVMDATMRRTGEDSATPLDLPNYGNGHIAFLHIAGATSPLTVTMWTDNPEGRMARIVRLGPQRHVVEFYLGADAGVLEDPGKETVELEVSEEERDVLGSSAVSAAQLFGSLSAETYARIWVEHGRVRADFRVVPRPSGWTPFGDED